MTGRVKQREVLEKLTDILVRRRLTTPAIFILEAGKPLSFVASQSMLFFEPFLEAFFPAGDYHIVAEALEDRENVEWFIQRLEAAEEDRRQERQQVKQ